MTYDYGFNTNSSTSRESDWLGLDSVYPTGEPRHTSVGMKVWIRHGARLIASYEITRITREVSRISSLNNRQYGPGWVIWLDNEIRVNIPLASIPDPDQVAMPWGSGPRYFEAGPQGPEQFVRVS